jgi:butyryl-CoA dehydrogenase
MSGLPPLTPRYNIDDRQQAVRDEVHAFCKKENIVELGRELDRKPEPRKFPRDLYVKLCKAGFVAYPFSKEYGGLGKSPIEYATLVEELCYTDAPICLLAAVGVLATEPIYHFAGEEQKKKYLPGCFSGDIVPAFVLTEPEAGSDASNQKTEFRIDGNDFIVSGEKIFIMHGDAADLFVLFGKVYEDGVRDKISTILLEANQPGITRRPLEYKMGMRAATTGYIKMKDVRVPQSTLMGERNKGFRYAMMTLDSARIGVAAQGVGVAQRALDEAVQQAKTREAFGAPIGKLQAIQWMIADMATRVEAARLLTYKAAIMQGQGERFGLAASQAKLYASETAGFCVDRAMQIFSGYGFIGEFSHIEKLYRDQRVMEIYEGTSEVQRLVIANTLLR